MIQIPSEETLKTAKDTETKDVEADGCTAYLAYFEEAEAFKNALQRLQGDVASDSQESLDRQLLWISLTIDKYQEAPQLLDAHLEHLVSPLVETLRSFILDASNEPTGQETNVHIKLANRLGPLSRVLYQLCKARGYKTILKFFSHDVSDLEPLLEFTEGLIASTKSGKSRLVYWETMYILLLWLTLVCMIPFDLKTLDTKGDHGHETTIMQRIISLGKSYLSAVGKEYEGAAVLLMRVFSRHDVARLHLADTLSWALSTMQSTKSTFELRGVLHMLCLIYKNGSRQVLLPTLPQTHVVFGLFDTTLVSSNALLRKILIKLCQRIGLCYMRPRVAKWRYQRGFRSLAANLAPQTINGSGASPVTEVDEIATEEEEYDDIPQVMENILDILLRGLNDRDTIVRWCAAKGIGRVTNRLPKVLADDVVLSVISILAEDVLADNDLRGVSDAAWHGACLALAELSRRGLLLPDRLPEVMPWINLALKFDQRRGSHSVGAHVRDAACYVFWSFARAYAPTVMAPFVTDMAKSLVILSVFDREVNIRRASSASFQENVGRQGTFPHGIDILTSADYFSVGTRTRAFHEVSLEIAQFPEYRHEMANHLTEVCVRHWDKNMRDLAATTLAKFTLIDSEYIVSKCLPSLINGVRDKDLVIRHGCILAIGEICLALSQIEDKEPQKHNSDILVQVTQLLHGYPAEFLESFGSDTNRIAICRYIECLSMAKWPAPDSIQKLWLSLLETSLVKKNDDLQVAAATSLGKFSAVYALNEAEIGSLIDKACNTSHGPLSRRGYTLIMGELASPIVEQYSIQILSSLVNALKVYNNVNIDDAKTRKNAMYSIIKVVTGPAKLGPDAYSMATEAFFEGLEDYSVDSHGDVGSWVRDASMKGLDILINNFLLRDQALTFLPESERSEFSVKVIAALCRQSVERIDKLRDTAGRALTGIIWNLNDLKIPGLVQLRKILNKDAFINWLDSAEMFPLMIQILDIDAYRTEFLKGLMMSVGGMTENLFKNSTTNLISYLENSYGALISLRTSKFLEGLEHVFRHYPKMDRLNVSFLDMLKTFFGCPSLIKEHDAFIFEKLYNCTVKIVFKSKDMKKLLAGLKVLGNMASLGPKPEFAKISKLATSKLTSYLVHHFPMIRRSAAEELYMVISMREPEEGRDFSIVEETLLTTDWDQSVASLKSVKEELSNLILV